MPLIVAAAIAGGAAIYSAKKSSDASKNAAKTQVDSADKAIDLQRDIYGQQTQNLAPYRALGEGSLANLGNFQSFAGVPGAFGAGVQSQYQRPLSPGYQSQQGGGATLANPTFNGAQVQPNRAMLRPGVTTGETVRLRAPNGEVRDVPRADAPRLMALGLVPVR